MDHIQRWLAVGLASTLALVISVSPVAAQSPATFTLQPGGRAVIQFEAFCTEFGKIFPTALQLPNAVAPDAARAAMSYGVAKGYTTDPAKALQLQYAVWQALGTANSPKGDATTQDVVTNGTTTPATPQGTSVLDAAKANQITLTLDSWQPIGSKVQITPTATDNFYGQGQLTITNTSQQAVTLYMPVGTLFPASDTSHQTMAGYATKVQVTNPAPQQLPKTGGEELSFLLPALALGLLTLGALTLGALRRI